MDKLDRNALMAFLSDTPLFRGLEEKALKLITSYLTPLFLKGGDYLLKENEEGDCLYILESGRLEIIKTDPDGEVETIAEIGRGEIVGEIALILKSKRNSTIRAIRDCVLYKLNSDIYEELVKSFPKSAIEITKFCLRRLTSESQLSRNDKTITFAIIPIGANPYCTEFVSKFATLLNMLGSTLHLNEELFAKHYKQDVGNAAPSDDKNLNITSWLHNQELKHRYIIYESGNVYNEWSFRCLRQADKIILVGLSGEDSSLTEIDEKILNYPNFEAVEKILILLSTSTSFDTQSWLKKRKIKNHYNVRLHSTNDFSRVIRSLTKNSIGLVLSGGGLRTLGYFGLFRALEELKIPIDMVAGSSAGAVISGMFAIGMDSKQMLEEYIQWKKIVRPLFSYTLPLLSVWNGDFITNLLRHLFKDTDIENLLIPFLCISSNISANKIHIHNEGKMREALRASVSIPAIFPPVINKDGEMLVDGGIINNFPVDIIRTRFECGKVIGARTLENNQTKFHEITSTYSGWNKLFNKLLPMNQRKNIPNIADVIMSSMSLASTNHDNNMTKETDINIEFIFDNMSWFDFKKDPKEIVNHCYHLSLAELSRFFR